MEGFLSLEQAAEQLDFSVSELARQIEEGRVVAIVKEGRSWLSAGEVSRLKRQSERSAQPVPAAPLEELRLLRRYPPEASKAANAPTASSPPETAALSLPTLVDVATDPPATEPLGPPATSDAPLPAPGAPPATPQAAANLTASEQATETPQVPVTKATPAVSSMEPTRVEAAPVRPQVERAADRDAESPPPAASSAGAAGSEQGAPSETLRGSTPAVQEKLAPPSKSSPPAGADEKLAQQVRELNKRCAELERRNLELEATANRLKSGLQETEATLKRNRAARSNLENDVIGLQDQLAKAKSRNEALEREVQRLGAEIERAEETHNSELRRLRSNKVERGSEDRDASPSGPAALAELEALRAQTSEKDRLLAQEYEQRATLRSQLEDQQQKYFELKARYDKEKTEWSELLAQAVQNQGQLRAQLEEMRAKSHPKGWNPFRREK